MKAEPQVGRDGSPWTSRGRVARLLLLGAALWSNGCSLLLAVDEQCTVDADCVQLGLRNGVCDAGACVAAPAADSWACLGQKFPPAGAQTFVIDMPLSDGVTGEPPQVKRVGLCTEYDLACASPLPARYVDGAVEADVKRGFVGRLLVEVEGALPLILFWSRPLDSTSLPEDPQNLGAFPVLNEATVSSLLTYSKLNYNPTTKGNAFFLALDCNGDPVEGVAVTVTGETGVSTEPADQLTPLYIRNSVPDRTLTATTASGQGAIANLEPGLQTLTFSRQATGQVVSSNSVLIQAGYSYGIVVLPTDASTKQ